MKVERAVDSVVVTLTPAEAELLRLALERASFVDTPPERQNEILSFCTKALDALG